MRASHGLWRKSRVKVVCVQAAAHRQGGRRFAPTPLGLLDFVARRTTRSAPFGPALKQVRRVSSRCASRSHEIEQTQAPRPPMRRGLPAHAFAETGLARRLVMPDLIRHPRARAKMD